MKIYLQSFALALGFVLLIALYVFEFPYFSNTFQVKSLIVVCSGLGVLIGILLGKHFSQSVNDSVERLQIYAFFIFVFAVFMPLFGSLSNRLLSYHSIQKEQVELFKIEARYADRFGVVKGQKLKPTDYFYFIIRKGQLERIKSKQPLFEEKEVDDWVDIDVKKGLWGWELVIISN